VKAIVARPPSADNISATCPPLTWAPVPVYLLHLLEGAIIRGQDDVF
jgi:hypothetical protein